MTKEIELLAPAGNIGAMVAAIENGANAIYLGGKLLNARKYASNFDQEELIGAIHYAHFHGVKIYVTVNILVDDTEIEEAIEYIRFLYESDVDAVIVQDMGIARLISRIFPDLEIHGSTQMTINNLYGAKHLEDLGFTRVILARETPAQEIKNIKENTNIELEAFVHGALCMGYSGQCLMSSFIGGRSGNRGTCAQPCRMQYNIVDENGKLMEKLDKLHYLSPKDLNTYEDLDTLVDAGISSLKIEGRMKRKEYVATVVKTYRKALDSGKGSITDQEKEDLSQVFTRGFTKGLGLGDFGRSFMSIDRPDNRGLLIGNIVDADRKNFYVKLRTDIDKGDGIDFQLSNGEYKGLLSPQDAKSHSVISLIKRGNVDIGSKVYRRSSIKLNKKVNQESCHEKKPIDMNLIIKQGSRPQLKVSYNNFSVEVEHNKEVEKSKNIPLSKEKAKEQMDRLGNTQFYLKDIVIDLEDNSFMTHKDLNRLRRQAIEKLEKKISNFNNRSKFDDVEFEKLKNKYLKLQKDKRDRRPKLSIKVENITQLKKVNLSKLDRIYLPVGKDLSSMIDYVNNEEVQIYLWTDKILYGDDLKYYSSIIDPSIDRIKGISVSNLGTYEYFKGRYDIVFNGDIGLNIFNSFAASYFLEEMGSVTLSPELNLKQINNISKKIGGDLESIVYGYVPVMITSNCPFASIKNCKDDEKCHACKFAKGYGLYDRMGMNFKSYRKGHSSIIYNSIPLMLLDKLEEIKKSGVNIFRLEFTDEVEDVNIIQSMYYDYLNGIIDYRQAKDFMETYKEDNDITMGHFYRGII